MKAVSLLRGVFYIDGQPVPASTACEVLQKELSKVYYENDALKSSNENLKAHIRAIED